MFNIHQQESTLHKTQPISFTEVVGDGAFYIVACVVRELTQEMKDLGIMFTLAGSKPSATRML